MDLFIKKQALLQKQLGTGEYISNVRLQRSRKPNQAPIGQLFTTEDDHEEADRSREFELSIDDNQNGLMTDRSKKNEPRGILGRGHGNHAQRTGGGGLNNNKSKKNRPGRLSINSRLLSSGQLP